MILYGQYGRWIASPQIFSEFQKFGLGLHKEKDLR